MNKERILGVAVSDSGYTDLGRLISEDIENSKPVEFPPLNDRNKAAIRNNEAEKAAMFREAIR